MKFIVSTHNSLPANKKNKEVSDICHKLVGTLLGDEDYLEMIEALRKLVDVANALYPRSRPLEVCGGRKDHLSIRVKDRQDMIYFAIKDVEHCWADVKDLLP